MEQSVDNSPRNSTAHPASSRGLKADDQSSRRVVNTVLETAANIFEKVVAAESQGMVKDEPMELIFRFSFDYDRPNAVRVKAVGEASIEAEAMTDAHYIECLWLTRRYLLRKTIETAMLALDVTENCSPLLLLPSRHRLP